MKRNSPYGSLVSRTNTIEPVVSSYKVAARISDNRTVEILECLNHIFAETILI